MLFCCCCVLCGVFRASPTPSTGPPSAGPKISLFFSLSRHSFFFFFPSLLVFFVEFLLFEAPVRSNVHIWSSGCRVRAPVARFGGAAGVSHDIPRAQTCTFEGPGLQKHHQNSTRRHPKRHRKSETVAGKGRKRAKFCAVRWRGVQWRGSGGEALNTHHTTHNNNQTTTQHTTEQHTPTTHSNNTQQQHRTLTHNKQARNKQHRTLTHTKTNHNTTTPKMDWQKLDWPKLAKPLTSNFGQKWIGQNWTSQSWPLPLENYPEP